MLTMRPIENEKLGLGAKSRTIDSVKIPTVDWNEQTKGERDHAETATAKSRVGDGTLERRGGTHGVSPISQN